MNLFSLDIAENKQLAIAVGTPEEPATLEFELWSFTLKVEEYDDFEEVTKYFYIDDRDWENAQNGDPKAAQAVADAIAEQSPESLEIISRYMADAAELGSKDAIDWLKEYYNGEQVCPICGSVLVNNVVNGREAVFSGLYQPNVNTTTGINSTPIETLNLDVSSETNVTTLQEDLVALYIGKNYYKIKR